MIKIMIANTNCLLEKLLFDLKFQELIEERKCKALKYKYSMDKALSAGAGLLLNEALEEYFKFTGCDKKDIKIKYGKYGKPYFDIVHDFNFNLSHSGEYVVCAISSKNIGIDLQKVMKLDDSMFRTCCCDLEYDYIVSRPNEVTRNNAFFEIWTLKESFLKARGESIESINTFSVIDSGKIKNKLLVDGNAYYFKQICYLSDYKLSISSNDNLEDIIIEEISLDL